MSIKQSAAGKGSKKIQERNLAEAEIKSLIKNSVPLMHVQPGAVFKNMRKAEDLSFKYEIDSYVPKILLLIGSATWQSGKYIQAIKILSRCSKLAKKQKLARIRCQAELNLGIAYFENGDYNAALNCYFNSFKLHNKFGPYIDIAAVFSNIGNVYMNLRKFKKAITYHKYALGLIKEKEEKAGLAFCLNNLGIAYMHKGNADKALNYLNKSLEISKKKGMKSMQMNALSNIASVYAKLGSYIESEELLANTILYFEKQQNPQALIHSLFKLATLKFYEKKYDEALVVLDKIIKTGIQQKIEETERDCWELYYKVYEAKGDLKKRNEYQQKYEKLKNILLKKLWATKMSNKKVNSSIAILEMKNKYSEDTNKELKTISKELAHITELILEDVREPLKDIIKAAAETGEGFGQKPDMSVSNQLDQIKNGISHIEKMTFGLLEYINIDSSNEFFESVNLNSIFQEVIGNMATFIEDRAAEVNIDSLPEVNAIPSQMKLLFRSLIENSLIFNTSAIPAVNIIAVTNSSGHTISIRDNGVGIREKDTSKIFELMQTGNHNFEIESSGIGLAVCKKIIEKHRGEIWFESVPGKGTTFYLNFPGN